MSALDVIAVTGIAGYGYHGVLEQERRAGQEFVVDIALAVDTRPAAKADDLSATVDYAAVAGRVHAIITGEPCDLIETLAERCVAVALDYPAVQRVEVTVHKPQAPVGIPFSDVTVTIVRARP